MINDLFGVYLGHDHLIARRFFQAQTFKKQLVMIRFGHKMENSDTEPMLVVCGVFSSRILIQAFFPDLCCLVYFSSTCFCFCHFLKCSAG